MLSKADKTTIELIAERAAAMFAECGAIGPKDLSFFRACTITELGIVHDEIVPLRLNDMLAGRPIDVVHDVAGIHRHITYGHRKLGTKARLEDCFLPRFAAVQP